MTWENLCETGNCLQVDISADSVKIRESAMPDEHVITTRASWEAHLAKVREPLVAALDNLNSALDTGEWVTEYGHSADFGGICWCDRKMVHRLQFSRRVWYGPVEPLSAPVATSDGATLTGPSNAPESRSTLILDDGRHIEVVRVHRTERGER